MKNRELDVVTSPPQSNSRSLIELDCYQFTRLISDLRKQPTLTTFAHQLETYSHPILDQAFLHCSLGPLPIRCDCPGTHCCLGICTLSIWILFLMLIEHLISNWAIIQNPEYQILYIDYKQKKNKKIMNMSGGWWTQGRISEGFGFGGYFSISAGQNIIFVV